MGVDVSQLSESYPPLNSYYVYVTGGCNLACRHCYLAPTFQKDGGTGGHLDYQLFESAIEQGIPLGLSHVKLTGGEPLLHPNFVRMVDLLREKSLGLTIETNGTLLTPTLARYLKDKSTLGHISISLDGSQAETHDAFRGVKGSFDRAIQAMHFLVDVGYRPQLIMSLHVDNVAEIETLVQLAQDLGASSVKFNLIQPTGRGQQMAERGQTLGIERLYELGRWVERELQPRVAIGLHYSWPMAFYSLKRLLTFSGYSCNIFNILGILSTGHLAMCGIGKVIPELCYGHLGEDSVAEVWRTNPTLLALREDIPSKLEGICGECILRDRCLGMCVAENYSVYGNLTSPFWFCHIANEKSLFPASRRFVQGSRE